MTERELLEGHELRGFLTSELGSLRRFALSITGSPDDADDIVQSTIERVLSKGLPAEAPKPWMIKVCRNIWIDELRKRRIRNHEEFTDGREEREEGSSVESDFASEQRLEAISAAMDRLSTEHRVVLSMVVVEGMSYAEIAEALDTPIGTVMSRVARARSNLKKFMTGDSDDQ